MSGNTEGFVGNAVNVSLRSHAGVCRSIHLSGIANGLVHVSEFARMASAVAEAPMFALVTPKMLAIIVDTAVPRSAVAYTRTCTRSDAPLGATGNVTSPVPTATGCPATWLARAALMAPCTAGPDDERLLKSLNASAVAPASAPESAAFCACDRALSSMPTSMASVLAAMKLAMPMLTNTSDMPRSFRVM